MKHTRARANASFERSHALTLYYYIRACVSRAREAAKKQHYSSEKKKRQRIVMNMNNGTMPMGGMQVSMDRTLTTKLY